MEDFISYSKDNKEHFDRCGSIGENSVLPRIQIASIRQYSILLNKYPLLGLVLHASWSLSEEINLQLCGPYFSLAFLVFFFSLLPASTFRSFYPLPHLVGFHLASSSHMLFI